MMNRYLLEQNTVLNELQFVIAAKLYSKIDQLFRVFMKSGLDENSLGFWIWDIPNNKELYSPKFRASLQFSGEEDFPSVPESWMSSIFSEDKDQLIDSFQQHISTRGEHKYIQEVRYHRKYNGHIKVLSQGQVISWDEEDNPLVMVGVHLDVSGLYQNTVGKFGSLLDEDVIFSDMMRLELNNRVKISEGIYFTMIKKNSISWSGVCTMEKGSELSIHHHSDYDELFEGVRGSVVDLLSGRVITKRQSQTFKRRTPHLMFCKQEATLNITGIFRS